jgi:sugar fermentation stimulation protein A
MIFFPTTITAVFQSRPNRFIVQCLVNDRLVRAYLPNPGRLHELFLPEAKLFLVQQELSQGRKIELAGLAGSGMATAVLFVVHSPRPRYFMPDYHTDLEFSRTLLAVRDRVMIRAMAVEWKSDLSLGGSMRELLIPWDIIEREARDRGSYLVLLHLSRTRRIRTGDLGMISFPKGFYCYVGSAPDDLSKRAAHHQRKRRALVTPIDHLREQAVVTAVLPVRAGEDLACSIADALRAFAAWSIPGFRSTDCSCDSHLFGMAEDPLHSPLFIKTLLYFRMDRLEEELDAAKSGTKG